MNPLEIFNKRAEAESKKVKTGYSGTFEKLARKWFGNNSDMVSAIDGFFGEDVIFPGLDSDSIKSLESLKNFSGENPLSEEINRRAEIARKKALNLKPIDPRFAERIIDAHLGGNVDIDGLSEAEKYTINRIIEESIENNTFLDLAQKQPNLIPIARELNINSTIVREKYPYLLNDPNERYTYGVKLATSNEDVTDPNIFRDPQILDGFVKARGNKSKINIANQKSFDTNVENTVRQNTTLSRNNSKIESAVTIGLRAINHQLLCKNDLINKLIRLRNNNLDVEFFDSLPNASQFPKTEENNIDFKQLDSTQQKKLIRHLEGLALISEFGTPLKDGPSLLNEIKSMSLEKLANTNVGQEIIYANNSHRFTTDFTPAEQQEILARAVATRAIAYNVYSAGITQLTIDSNSKALSEGVQTGQKSGAIYTQTIESIEDCLTNNKFENSSLYITMGILEVSQKLEQIATTSQGDIDSAFEIKPSDNISIGNEEFLSGANPLQRFRNVNNLCFALAQLTHKNDSTRQKGKDAIFELLQISESNFSKILLKLQEKGRASVEKNMIFKNQGGELNLSYTKSKFITVLQTLKETATKKFIEGLEAAKNEMFPADFIKFTQSENLENYINQINPN